MVRSCSISLNGMNTSTDLNIIPLGSYDVLIGMDWQDKHHIVLDFHNNTFTCLDRNGKQRTVKGVPRPISIRDILALQLKKNLEKNVNCMQLMWKRNKIQRDQALKNSRYYMNLKMYSNKYQGCHQKGRQISLLIQCLELPHCQKHLTR